MSRISASVFELYAGVREITMEFEFRLWWSPGFAHPARPRSPLDMPRQFKTRGARDRRKNMVLVHMVLPTSAHAN